MVHAVHKTSTSPAPIGGLNIADSLVSMPSTDATVMRNFFTQPYGCEVRRGTVRHATGLPDAVESLISHINPTDNTTKIFAFSSIGMYDITAPGNMARTANPAANALTNARFNSIGMTNAAGYNVVAYNGVDNGIWIHNDHSITRISLAAVPGAPGANEISGVDPKNLIGGCIHQRRMWLIQKNSTKAWYLSPEAITGTATLFDFGAVFSKGGKLVALASWTLDSGSGPDDLLVAISELGEVAIYTGTDPATAASWILKGVFHVGSPVTARGVVSVAGDLLILTKFGMLSMNAAIGNSNTDEGQSNSYLSQKVQYLISSLTGDLADEFGWDVISWPDNNMILINVPLVGSAGQLVQSTITKGWAQWDNINAKCWAVINGGLMFGDPYGNVYRAWEGFTDNAIQSDADTITDGDPILAELQTSFNYYGGMTTVKHAKMVRPVFMNTAYVPYAVKANPDFKYDTPLATGASNKPTTSVWGIGKWGTAEWSGGVMTQKLWSSVTGLGSAFAIRIALQCESSVLLAAYDFMYEEGTGI